MKIEPKWKLAELNGLNIVKMLMKESERIVCFNEGCFRCCNQKSDEYVEEFCKEADEGFSEYDSCLTIPRVCLVTRSISPDSN
jgi:hypothetical protein